MNKKRKLVIAQAAFLFFVLIAVFLINNNNQGLLGFTIYENQPNPTEGKDTYIRESPVTGFPTAATMLVGKNAAGKELHTLLEFNVSSISAVNTITSAVLSLYMSSFNNETSLTINVYKVTNPWTEANVNWINTTSSDTWFSPGGDYSTLLDTKVISNVTGWYNFSILSAVRTWVSDVSLNYGIILVASGGTAGNFKEFYSSDYAGDTSFIPKITIEHTENAPPTITALSTNSNLQSLKNVGENVTFEASWIDLESNPAKLFVCNSSSITASGCAGSTLCTANFSSTSPSTCQYTVQNSDNRTTAYWLAMCDAGNCSSANQSDFYANHAPRTRIIQPNGDETINQSQGNYTIKFSVNDTDGDLIYADIYYGLTSGSMSYPIVASLNLTTHCVDFDSTTKTNNNCNYTWDSTGVYGNYFLTIVVNDTYMTSYDSSDSSFTVQSLIDNTPPNITAVWLSDSEIFSGKTIQIYANITELNINNVWAAIDTAPQQNITLRNSTGASTYNASFTAPETGNYTFIIYADDRRENSNFSSQYYINVSKPQAVFGGTSYPASAMPYNVIRISSQLNATNPLRDIYAYLNVPSTFSFSGSQQNTNTGNYTAGESKNTTWFLSTPLDEGTYTFNFTYTDKYLNSWISTSSSILVSSAASAYLLSINGYPEVETSASYFVKAFFTKSGVPTSTDTTLVTIYDSLGNLIAGPASMSNPRTGEYNYTYAVGASVNEGQWETIINATKSGISYYSRQFWKVVGGPFDVRDIVINSYVSNNLNISITTENTGGAIKDLVLSWELRRNDNNAILDSGQDTFAVNPHAVKKWSINPKTNYIGDVKITFLGTYSGTEKAGAFKIFTTTAPSGTGETPSTGGTGGGGGGGGATALVTTKNQTTELAVKNLVITANSPVYIARNIVKNTTITIKNLGSSKISDINLYITGLPQESYQITPKTISLNKGEEASIKVEFLITDQTGEIPIKYIASTKDGNYSKLVTLIVLTVDEYVKNELKLLKERKIDIDKILPESLASDMSKCDDLIKEAESALGEERYIDTKNKLPGIENCLANIENKIKKTPSIEINFKDYGYLIMWILLLVGIIAIIITIRIFYKKLTIVSFLKKETENQPSAKIDLKEENFEDKIKDIEKRLNGQK